jgi:hypothetical protein
VLRDEEVLEAIAGAMDAGLHPTNRLPHDADSRRQFARLIDEKRLDGKSVTGVTVAYRW